MICAIILAAGDSARMGRTKALLQIADQTFIELINQNVVKAGIKNIYVVLGRDEQKIVSRVNFEGNVHLLQNPDPDRGQLSSLQLCIPNLPEESRGFIMALVDHPLVLESTYQAICKCAEKDSDKIIIPSYQGRKGHPVYFGRKYYDQLTAAPLSEGARSVVRKNLENVVILPVTDIGILKDIDLPEDYNHYISGLKM